MAVRNVPYRVKRSFRPGVGGQADVQLAGQAPDHPHALVQKIAEFADEVVILADTGVHAKAGDPPNLKVRKRGTWNVRMVVEQVLTMLTKVCQFKKAAASDWTGFDTTRLAFTMALFNVLVDWNRVQIDRDGTIHLSIAQFSL